MTTIRDLTYQERYSEAYRIGYPTKDRYIIEQYLKKHSKDLTASKYSKWEETVWGCGNPYIEDHEKTDYFRDKRIDTGDKFLYWCGSADSIYFRRGDGILEYEKPFGFGFSSMWRTRWSP